MEETIEQFIASDRPKSTSNMFRNLGIVTAAFGILFFMKLPIIGIALEIAAMALIISSYFMYIDYEYELFQGSITISQIYKASRRRIVQKIDRDNVHKVYEVKREQALKNGVKAYYNTRLNGLKIYTFELNNNKKIQLALNESMCNMIDILYKQQMVKY